MYISIAAATTDLTATSIARSQRSLLTKLYNSCWSHCWYRPL